MLLPACGWIMATPGLEEKYCNSCLPLRAPHADCASAAGGRNGTMVHRGDPVLG